MGSAYLLAGMLIMAAILKAKPGEGGWALLLIPAAICMIIAWGNEEGRGR